MLLLEKDPQVMNSTFPPPISDTMTFLLTPKILVVDDSETELAMVRAIIQRTKPDWEVETAASGQQAIVQIENSLPDIVVTDLRMPIMDGIELVRKVSSSYPELPVILITARGSEGLAVREAHISAQSHKEVAAYLILV